MLWMIGAIVAVLLLIAYMIYKLPADQAAKRKKEKKVALPTDPDAKDWKEIAIRWEKKNNALLGDVEKMIMNEKKLLKEIDAQKEHVSAMIDKMALEKSWREKEQGGLEKARQHEKELREQIMRTEKDLEREHSLRLQFERELQEIRIKFDQTQEEKRQATVNASSLSTTVKQLQSQVKDLTKINEELKQRREDVQWVAKSEYDELMRKYKALEK